MINRLIIISGFFVLKTNYVNVNLQYTIGSSVVNFSGNISLGTGEVLLSVNFVLNSCHIWNNVVHSIGTYG